MHIPPIEPGEGPDIHRFKQPDEDDREDYQHHHQQFEDAFEEDMDDVSLLPEEYQSDALQFLRLDAMSVEESYAKARNFFLLGRQLIPIVNGHNPNIAPSNVPLLQLSLVLRILSICITQYGVINGVQALTDFWWLLQQPTFKSRIYALFQFIAEEPRFTLTPYKGRLAHTQQAQSAISQRSFEIKTALQKSLSPYADDDQGIQDLLRRFVFRN